jgi:hypothetical protein
MHMGRYRDIDIHLNLKGCSPGLSTTVRSDVSSLSIEANRIIQTYVERYRLQGWRTEGPTDFLTLFEERRLTYRPASLSKPARFVSARVTLCKDSNIDNSEQVFTGTFTVSARVKNVRVPLWLVFVIVVAAVALYAVITQLVLKR